jgi:CubicO group peptidase (beta-lactamase class C family)
VFLIFYGFIFRLSDGNKNLLNDVVRRPSGLPSFSEKATKTVSIKLDSLFKRVNKRYDFNGSVLVAKNGKLIFSNHYGYADFKEKTTIDSSSAFQLASVSKQFTATAVLMLYEDSLIALDDSITKYFPVFPYQMTIRQLLTHTSGLPKYFWLAEHEWKKEKAPLNNEMMNMIGEFDLPLFFYPGSIFDYSNTGYMVLASLVEKVSGLSYSDFLENNIFKPAKMTNTFVYRFGEDAIRTNQLDGYRIYRGWRHRAIPGTVNDGIVGDKNIYSTTEDLFKWINALNSGELISEESLEMMYSNGKTRWGRNVPYGFGFRISNKESGKVIYHFGKWNGFSTAIKQYPDNLVIILLEHSSYNSTSNLTKNVRSIVDAYFVN